MRFLFLQRCSEIQELSQNAFLMQSVLPVDGCCEDLEVSGIASFFPRVMIVDWPLGLILRALHGDALNASPLLPKSISNSEFAYSFSLYGTS